MSESNHKVFVTLGSSNHSDNDRAVNDFYTTDPIAIKKLMPLIKFSRNIWEPACGLGHLSETLREYGYCVKSTDLVDRGYGTGGVDFLASNEVFDGDIITNPPYSLASEFCYKAINSITDKHMVAMFLRLNFLEGKARRKLFDEYPPRYIYVASGRINCYKNGDDSPEGKKNVGALAYAWFIWEKGYKGDTVIRWFN